MLLRGTLVSTLLHDVDVRLITGNALVTTALCWLPGIWWSYSQYSLEICCATECFWYWRRTSILGDFGIWYLVSGIWFEIWNWWLESGIRFEVFASVWSYYGTAILSPINCAWRISIAQGGYWWCICLDEECGIAQYRAQNREDVDCACARYDGDRSFRLLGSSSDR